MYFRAVAKEKKYSFTFEEDDISEFDLIGICSHVPFFKLTWDINRSLDFQLALAEKSFTVFGKKGVEFSFPYYSQSIEDDFLSIYLIKNKDRGQTLIPELSQIDYFLFFVNNQTQNLTAINTKLKTLDSVILSEMYDPKQYASTSNIIFE